MIESRFSEALILAKDLLYEIENGKEDTQLVLSCLKSSRLALLVNDPIQSEGFTKLADQTGESSSYLASVENRFETVLKDEPSSFSPFPRSQVGSLRSSFHVEHSDEERNIIRQKQEIKKLQDSKHQLSKTRTQIYKFALNIYYKLRFSDVPEHFFELTRLAVDKRLLEVFPESKEKFYSVYSNLESENSEDWSNAVHSCRRLLQALADKLYPPKDGGTIKSAGKDIKIGSEAYINRLMLYVENKSQSDRFNEIVGSHLKYLGERLDAIYKAMNKGTHTDISSRQEAERYIIFTYLLIGDILSL